MAKAFGNPIFSGYKGRLGSIDRTIGRDGGLSLNLINSGKDTILGVKPLMPRTKSPGRQARSTAYCSCDALYKTLSLEGKQKLQAWQILTGSRDEKRLTPFQFFIKLCLIGELCDLKKWSGFPAEVTPPCPEIPLSHITHIAKYNPTINYYGRVTAEVYRITGISSLETLIDLETEAYAPTLHTYHSYTGYEGHLLDVYEVATFDPQTVTWDSQPEDIRKVGSFTPVGNAWNSVLLDNPGRYIRIKFNEAATDGYTSIRSKFYLEGQYTPYITY